MSFGDFGDDNGNDFGSFTTVRSSKYGDSFDVPNSIIDQPEMVKTFIESQRDLKRKTKLPTFDTSRKPVPETTTWHDSLPGILTDPNAYKNFEFHPVEDIWEPTKLTAEKLYKAALPTYGDDPSAPFGISLPTQKAGKAIGESLVNVGKSLWGGDYGGAAGEAGVTAAEQTGLPLRSGWAALTHPTIQNVREAGTDLGVGAGLAYAGMRGHTNQKGWAKAAADREAATNLKNFTDYHSQKSPVGPYPDMSGGEFDLGGGPISDAPIRNRAGASGFGTYERRAIDAINRHTAEQAAAEAEAARVANNPLEWETPAERQARTSGGQSVSRTAADFPGLSGIVGDEVFGPKPEPNFGNRGGFVGSVAEPDVPTIGNKLAEMENRASRSMRNADTTSSIQAELERQRAIQEGIQANQFENQDWYEQRKKLGESVAPVPEDYPGLSSIANEPVPPTNETMMRALVPQSIVGPHLPSTNRTVFGAIVPERIHQASGMGLSEPEPTYGLRESPPNVSTFKPVGLNLPETLPDSEIPPPVSEPTPIAQPPTPQELGPIASPEPTVPQLKPSMPESTPEPAKPVGKPTVKKSKSEDGGWDVTFPDGRKYGIYRDTHQFGTPIWYVKGLDNAVSGFTKAEMVDYLANLDESKPHIDAYSGRVVANTLKESLDKWRNSPEGQAHQGPTQPIGFRKTKGIGRVDEPMSKEEVYRQKQSKIASFREKERAFKEAQRLARESGQGDIGPIGEPDLPPETANDSSPYRGFQDEANQIKQLMKEGKNFDDAYVEVTRNYETDQHYEDMYEHINKDRRILNPDEETRGSTFEDINQPDEGDLHSHMADSLDDISDDHLREVVAERLAKLAPQGGKIAQMVARQKAGIGGVTKWIQQHFTESDEHALGKFGEAGKFLVDTARKTDADSARFSAVQIGDLKRAVEGVAKKDRQTAFEEAVNHVETGTTSQRPEIQTIVDVLKRQDVAGNKLYTESGMKTKNPVTGKIQDYAPRENYFPHVYPEGFLNNDTTIARALAQEAKIPLAQAQKIIASGAKYGYGFLDSLKSRLRDLPGYRKDIDVQIGHYIDMARKAYIDKNFGELGYDPKLGEKNSPVSKAIQKIGEEYGPEAMDEAENIMSRYMGKDLYQGPKAFREGANFVTKMESISKLSLSSLRNLPGGVASTLARTEVMPFMKSLGEVFTKQGRNMADEMGTQTSLWRDAAHDVGYGSEAGKIYGVEASERFLRRFAALAGKNEVQKLFARAKANPTEFNKGQLKNFILEDNMDAVLQQDKLTDNQVARAANRMVDQTQGRANSLSMPHGWSSPNPVASILTQFRKYAFIQSKNYKDAFFRGYEPTAADLKSPATMAKLSYNWNYKMVPRLLTGMAVLGEVPADIRAWIKGDKRPDPWTMKRAVDNVSTAFGFGQVQDVMQAFSKGGPGDAALAMLPPALSDIARFGSAGAKTVQGKPNSLAQEVAGQIPFVGSRLRKVVKGKTQKKKEVQYY